MAIEEQILWKTDIDAIALKPSKFDLGSAHDMPFDNLIIDFEGVERFPASEELKRLDTSCDVMVTTPVRADGFDPLGDHSITDEIPRGIGRVVVAGHPSYLTDRECARVIAPRVDRAIERDPSAWVGTEGIERIALATGVTQFDLLSGESEQRIKTLRSKGYAGDIAIYAPTIPTEDTDVILDAVGSYVARRNTVSRHLPTGSASNSTIDGEPRSILLRACRRFALTGSLTDINDRISSLKSAGADLIVGYPAPHSSVLPNDYLQ